LADFCHWSTNNMTVPHYHPVNACQTDASQWSINTGRVVSSISQRRQKHWQQMTPSQLPITNIGPRNTPRLLDWSEDHLGTSVNYINLKTVSHQLH